MVIIDIFNIIYRAIGVASSKKEEEYLYGSLEKTFMQIFFKSFNRIFRNFRDHKIIIAWEGSGRCFRYDLYPEYKQNRDYTIKNYITSDVYGKLKAGLLLYGCTILDYETAEADDLIYSLCDIFREQEKIIISSDEDFIQLLQNFDNIKLFSPTKDKYLESPQYNYIMYKSIKGDTSDNIKGLIGFGEVKSRNVLNNYDIFWSSLTEEKKQVILRNTILIDLSKNPEKDQIREYILVEIKKQNNKFDFNKIANFMMRHQLKDIFAKIRYELRKFD